jgi:hypothetical protein
MCDCRPPGTGLFGTNTAKDEVRSLPAVEKGTTTTAIAAIMREEKRLPTAIVSSHTTVSEERASESAQEGCIPGQYWCDQTTYEWVMVCKQAGQWEKSSYCGKTDQGHGWQVTAIPLLASLLLSPTLTTFTAVEVPQSLAATPLATAEVSLLVLRLFNTTRLALLIRSSKYEKSLGTRYLSFKKVNTLLEHTAAVNLLPLEIYSSATQLAFGRFRAITVDRTLATMHQVTKAHAASAVQRLARLCCFFDLRQGGRSKAKRGCF